MRRQRIWTILEGLRNAGATLLQSTHQLDEIQYVCDRMLILDEVAGNAIEIEAEIRHDLMAEASADCPPTQVNAEVLAGIVLTQLVREGAPVVFAGSSSSSAMRYGTLSIGSPEMAVAPRVELSVGTSRQPRTSRPSSSRARRKTCFAPTWVFWSRGRKRWPTAI